MLALIGANHSDAFDTVNKWVMDSNVAGRQLAHAMAHGFYGCRKYVILYNEDSGKFSIVRN